MEAAIAKLEWREDYDFDKTNSFEGDARHLRYQALARECLRKKISSLFVAHHANDQAETIMMRLVKGRWRSGLQGMQEVDSIPENYGVYGAYHSGDPVWRKENRDLNQAFPYEAGGIKVLRPLLGFEKDRLIATCEARNIPWAEDKTNHMPTLTSRNAIRHVMTHHRLPEALSTRSLCNLADHMKQRVQKHRDIAEDIFNATPIALDIQSGSMVIRPPAASEFLPRPIRSDEDRVEARNTAALYLERLANLITPREGPSPGQFSTGINHIWPSLRVDPSARSASPAANSFTETSCEGTQSDTFCVHGVQFRPTSALDHKKMHYTSPALPRDSLRACWHLQRQPPTPQERSSASALITIPPNTNTPTWHLFDNRWWISLSNPHLTHAYIVRFLTTADLPKLKILHHLPLLKLDRLRFTIPALFMRKQAALTGEEVITSAESESKSGKPRKGQKEKEARDAEGEVFVGLPSLYYYPQPSPENPSFSPLIPCPPLSANLPQYKDAIAVHYKAIDVKNTQHHIITEDLASVQERQRKEKEQKLKTRKNKFADKVSRRNNGGIARSPKTTSSKTLWAQGRSGREETKAKQNKW